MMTLWRATLLLLVMGLFAIAMVGFREAKVFDRISNGHFGERPSGSVLRPADDRRLCAGATTPSERAERGHLCPIS